MRPNEAEAWEQGYSMNIQSNNKNCMWSLLISFDALTNPGQQIWPPFCWFLILVAFVGQRESTCAYIMRNRECDVHRHIQTNRKGFAPISNVAESGKHRHPSFPHPTSTTQLLIPPSPLQTGFHSGNPRYMYPIPSPQKRMAITQ